MLLSTKFPPYYHIFWFCFSVSFVIQCLPRATQVSTDVQLSTGSTGPRVSYPWLYHWKKWFPRPLVAIHYCCCPWALLTSMTGLQYLLAQLWACPVLRTEAVVISWNSWPCHAHKAALLASLPVISSFHDVPWALEGVLRISCWELTPHWSLVPSTLTSCVSLHWSPISIMRRVWSLPRTTLVHWYKHKYLRNSLTACPLKMSVV